MTALIVTKSVFAILMAMVFNLIIEDHIGHHQSNNDDFVGCSTVKWKMSNEGVCDVRGRRRGGTTEGGGGVTEIGRERRSSAETEVEENGGREGRGVD